MHYKDQIRAELGIMMCQLLQKIDDRYVLNRDNEFNNYLVQLADECCDKLVDIMRKNKLCLVKKD